MFQVTLIDSNDCGIKLPAHCLVTAHCQESKMLMIPAD